MDRNNSLGNSGMDMSQDGGNKTRPDGSIIIDEDADQVGPNFG